MTDNRPGEMSDAQLELFVIEGGQMPHHNGSISVRWRFVGSRTIPTADDIDFRREIVGKLLALAVPEKPKRAKRLESNERLGRKNLSADDQDTYTNRSKRGRVRVRVYYRSIGDEILCFDSDPMTIGRANEIVKQHGNGGNRLRVAVTDAVDAHLVFESRSTSKLPEPKHGARLVVLPSQSSEPIEREE